MYLPIYFNQSCWSSRKYGCQPTCPVYIYATLLPISVLVFDEKFFRKWLQNCLHRIGQSLGEKEQHKIDFSSFHIWTFYQAQSLKLGGVTIVCTDTQGSHRWRISFIILLRKQKNSICMLDTFLDKVQSLWKILWRFFIGFYL